MPVSRRDLEAGSAVKPSRQALTLFQSGVDHHAAGRLEQAYRIYRQVIALQPRYPECQFRLGVLTAQIGRNDLAVGHFQIALQHEPRALRCHLHLGMALDGLGRAEDAAAAYRTALALDPAYAPAHNNLANTLGRLGRLEEAEHHYRAALAINPAMPEAHNNLGHALIALGRPEAAEASCRQALQLRPSYPAALANLGTALAALGKIEAAELSFRASLDLRREPATLRSLAGLLGGRRRFGEAAELYRDILRLKPEDASARHELADILVEAYRYEDAVDCYRAALELDRDRIAAWNDLAYVLGMLGRQSEAVLCYDEILRRSPGSVSARLNRCISFLPVAYRDETELVAAREQFSAALAEICAPPLRWIEPLSGLPPFYLAYQGCSDRELQALYGGFIVRMMAALYPSWTVAPEIGPPALGEKIRVGILSPFFHAHSNWKIPIKGWLQGLDREQFQIFLYHVGDEVDDETEAARGLCDRFTHGLGALEPWAETIRADRLHVLLIPGIGLDALTHRLAALKLAPVQATSWGHPDTTGLPTVDDYLSSDLMEPENGQEHYTERLIRLPNLSICYEPLALPEALITRAELGVPEEAVFYWCCQALFKYLPRHDWIYPRIAAAVPQACFVFVEYGRGPAVTEIFRERLERAFAASGLDASRHCRFVKPLPMARFGAVSRVADLFLDSLGWSGCNTLFEALAYDLPAVTMAGELMRGRHGSAILTMLGLPELIAQTPDAFVDLAIALGRDPDRRQALSRQIAGTKHRLYGDHAAIDGLTRYLEQAANNIKPLR